MPSFALSDNFDPKEVSTHLDLTLVFVFICLCLVIIGGGGVRVVPCPLKGFFLWSSVLKVRALSANPWWALRKTLTTCVQYRVRLHVPPRAGPTLCLLRGPLSLLLALGKL